MKLSIRIQFCSSFHFVLVRFVFVFVLFRLFVSFCVYVYINVLLEIISSQSVIKERYCAAEKLFYINSEKEKKWTDDFSRYVCPCVWKKSKKLTNKQKKIEPHVFFFLSHHTDFVRLHSHTYKETQKRRRRENAAGCLARPTNKTKERKIRSQKEEEEENGDRSDGDNNNNGNRGRKKRKREGVTVTHTLKRAHQHPYHHHQNGTRDEVKKKEEGREGRQTKKNSTHTHTRECLADEQRTKDPRK